MFTGFQSNAFQSNAFQIVRNITARDQGAGAGGSSGKRKRGRTQKDIHALLEEYKRALEIAPQEISREISEAIEPILENKVRHELTGLFIPPEVKGIDMGKLKDSQLILERIEFSIEMFRRWEEEELCMILLLI